MAAHSLTAPGPRAVNAALHPLAERRAPAASGGDTPPRRALRRRFFVEAGATLALSLGATAAVLAPDPTWGAPAAVAGSDAALLAAITRGTAIYDQARRARAAGGDTFRTWILDNCAEVVPLDEFIFSTPAVTREGAMAKAAYALKDYRPPEGEGRVGTYHFPYSALEDLCRVLGQVQA